VFDKVVAGKSPLSPFLEKKFLRTIRAKLTAKSTLPILTTCTLWAMVFVSEWLEQVTGGAGQTASFAGSSRNVAVNN
jgi:hypothetical protein